jgi:NitT/TauT family transport system substrate-binding protein
MPVRAATRRNIAWAAVLGLALAAVGVELVRSGDIRGDIISDEAVVPDSPGPRVPDDLGSGCGRAAATDPADASAGRPVARCAAGAPAADPLPEATTLRVAVAHRSEAEAPLLVADALGELEAENLAVDITEMPQAEAYAALDAGDVDVVVGGMDGPFFDAAHAGSGARLVLGGSLARAPGDVDTDQAGLWLRADLIDDTGHWNDVKGQSVLVPGGQGAAVVYPIAAALEQHELDPNSVFFEPETPDTAAERLMAASVGGAWLTEPAATRAAAENGALRLVATVPGGEPLDGTVFGPRLLGPDRAAGLAFVRAIVRTINTHLAEGYTDDARTALADALGLSDDEIGAGPSPVFDWEIRAGTTTRIQESLADIGGIRYERPDPERNLVDRSLVADVIAAG